MSHVLFNGTLYTSELFDAKLIDNKAIDATCIRLKLTAQFFYELTLHDRPGNKYFFILMPHLQLSLISKNVIDHDLHQILDRHEYEQLENISNQQALEVYGQIFVLSPYSTGLPRTVFQDSYKNCHTITLPSCYSISKNNTSYLNGYIFNSYCLDKPLLTTETEMMQTFHTRRYKNVNNTDLYLYKKELCPRKKQWTRFDDFLYCQILCVKERSPEFENKIESCIKYYVNAKIMFNNEKDKLYDIQLCVNIASPDKVLINNTYYKSMLTDNNIDSTSIYDVKVLLVAENGQKFPNHHITRDTINSINQNHPSSSPQHSPDNYILIAHTKDISRIDLDNSWETNVIWRENAYIGNAILSELAFHLSDDCEPTLAFPYNDCENIVI